MYEKPVKDCHIRMLRTEEYVVVKFCGLTIKEDIAAVNELKPEWIGMVLFFPKSKRNLTPEAAEQLLSELDPDIRRVAVMVSPDQEKLDYCKNAGFDYLQIHGDATDELLSNAPLPVILAMNGTEKDKLDRAFVHPAVKGILFDAPQPGSGKAGDWSSIPGKEEIQSKSVGDKLLFLSGGLNSENVAAAIQMIHPDVVDVSSGIEWDDPARKGKDPDKMRAFLKAAGIKAGSKLSPSDRRGKDI